YFTIKALYTCQPASKTARSFKLRANHEVSSFINEPPLAIYFYRRNAFRKAVCKIVTLRDDLFLSLIYVDHLAIYLNRPQPFGKGHSSVILWSNNDLTFFIYEPKLIILIYYSQPIVEIVPRIVTFT